MYNQTKYINNCIENNLKNMEFYKQINRINQEDFFEYNLGIVIETFIK